MKNIAASLQIDSPKQRLPQVKGRGILAAVIMLILISTFVVIFGR